MVASNDVIQTRRYQNGTDPQQTAGGPTTGTFAEPGETVAPESRPAKSAPGIKIGSSSVLRVEQANAGSNNLVKVNLKIDGVGGESEFAFILNYDPAKLSNPVIGAGDAGAVSRACNSSVAGRINCSIGAFMNNVPGSSSSGIGELLAGNDKTLITVTFDVVVNAPSGKTVLTLSNVNVSNDAAELMRIVPVNGTITIPGAISKFHTVDETDTSDIGLTSNRVLVWMNHENGQRHPAFTNSFRYAGWENVTQNAFYGFTLVFGNSSIGGLNNAVKM
jgi:hypothetical protein